MKRILTDKESDKLIKLGVPEKFASKQKIRKITDCQGNLLDKKKIKRWKDCQVYEKINGNLTIGLTRFEKKSIFTLEDLIDIIPKTLNYLDKDTSSNLNLEFISDEYLSGNTPYWEAKYIEVLPGDADWSSHIDYKEEYELIDAIYSLLCEFIKSKHITFKEDDRDRSTKNE